MAERRLVDVVRWLPFVGGCVAIWLLSDMPRPPVPEALAFPHADKLLHFIAYAGLCALGVLGATPRRLVVPFVLTVLWGAVDELHQGFVPGRERSLLDLVADGLGAAATIGVVRRVRGPRAQPS